MTTSNAGKALPIILAAITIVTALFFWKQREVLRTKTQELLDLTELVSTKLPEPTPKQSPTPTPTLISRTNESNKSLAKQDLASPDNLTNKPNTLTQKTLASAKTTTTIICTPVYGMANSCAEHVVVDTGLDTDSLLNASAISYVLGLAAFIKAKKRA